MNGFDDRLVVNMNMYNRSCHVILDTGISYNKSIRRIQREMIEILSR